MAAKAAGLIFPMHLSKRLLSETTEPIEKCLAEMSVW